MIDALRNLVENALQYTPEGTEVQVTVRDDAVIEVTDRGLGIEPEHLERVWDRFWRSPAANTPGAGLGLAIVAEVMKLHGGSVEVENRSEGGARFLLRFPGR